MERKNPELSQKSRPLLAPVLQANLLVSAALDIQGEQQKAAHFMPQA
jgi:hypothetical protein